MIGYIYLLQEREFIKTKEYIYINLEKQNKKILNEFKIIQMELN